MRCTAQSFILRLLVHVIFGIHFQPASSSSSSSLPPKTPPSDGTKTSVPKEYTRCVNVIRCNTLLLYIDRRRHRRKWHMCVHQAPAFSSSNNNKKPMKRATSKRCRLGLRKTKPLKKLIKFLLNLCATAEHSYTGGIAATNCEEREREKQPPSRKPKRNKKRNRESHFFPLLTLWQGRILLHRHFDFDKSFGMFCAFFSPSRSRLTQSNQILLSFVSWRQISSHSNRAPGLFSTTAHIFLRRRCFFFLSYSFSFIFRTMMPTGSLTRDWCRLQYCFLGIITNYYLLVAVSCSKCCHRHHT